MDPNKSNGSPGKSNPAYRHGASLRGKVAPEYTAYVRAKGRCTNPEHLDYPNYGGRGIKFFFKSFEEFFKEVGKRPTNKHSLDRKNNNGHYKKRNLRWATKRQQMVNRRPWGSKDRKFRALGLLREIYRLRRVIRKLKNAA
jgi:hypothetical protein